MTNVPQVTVRWLKSRRSAEDTACVELSNFGAVRDSKNPAGPALAVALGGLVAAAKGGLFDR